MRALFIPFDDMLHPWFDDVVGALDPRCSVELIDPERPFADQVEGARAVVDQGGWGSPGMLDAAAAAGVELWQVLGTGLDHFELEHALDRGLTVANTPGQFSAVGLAEHALLLMLACFKNLDASRLNAFRGRFYHPLNDELEGRLLALVGFGASARSLARRAGPLGMRLAAVDVVPIDDELRRSYGLDWAGGPDELDALLAEADVVSLHVPLTAETANVLDARRIALLKPGAVVVNVARGGLIDEPALTAALAGGRLRAAGLDVFAREPLPADHPLFALPNVVVTPHVAGGTSGTSRRRGAAVAENLRRLLDGEPVLHLIESVEASA